MKTLEPAAASALLRLLAKNQNTWKAVVRNLWEHSDQVRTDDEHTLYRLRSTHGPTWLRRATRKSLRLSAEIATINATPVGTIEKGPDGRNRYVPARPPAVLDQAREAIAAARAGRGDKAVREIGEHLARKLTASTSFTDLLEAWPRHGYRPTIRTDMGEEYEALAELYDYAQALAGRQVVAYRGSGGAWSRREQVADPI